MKQKKGKQALPIIEVKKPSKLDATIMGKLNGADNKLLLYSDLYKAGHRRDLLKKTILNLETQGKIHIIPKRTGDLKFVVSIASTDNPSASEVLEPLIDKFNSSSDATKKIILGTIYEKVSSGLFNPDLIDFLSYVIKEKNYSEFNDFAFGSLYNIFKHAKKFEALSVIKKLDELKSDKKLIDNLKDVMLIRIGRENTPLKNKKFYAFAVLSYISPRDAIETFFYNATCDELFALPIHISKIIIDCQRKTGYDRHEIIKKCEHILTMTSDSEKIQMATIIIGEI